MENSNETIELATETMHGDLVAIVINELKNAKDVWQKLGQEAQEDVISRCAAQCESLIRRTVKAIAADGRDVITADLDQLTAKDDIKAVCKIGKHDQNRHSLLDAVGKTVLIVVADANQFLGGALPQADADQPDLLDTPVADNGLATAVAA